MNWAFYTVLAALVIGLGGMFWCMYWLGARMIEFHHEARWEQEDFEREWKRTDGFTKEDHED